MPLIGTIGFIFSVLATFGVTVLIFQEGALGLIANPKPILSFLPIFLIGVVFGLAMDYQVFLVSRMREGYIHGMPTKDAIVAGYRHARVVVSAAIIMISVFSAFMLSPDTLAKMMGFALAIAIIFDHLHHPDGRRARGDRPARRPRVGSAQVAGQIGLQLRHRG